MTDRPFRFSVQFRNWVDPNATAETARLVESLGYDEMYSFDHVGAVDPFLPLVAAAAATERLKVGPLVINNELHHPVLLARAAATLDAVTGGRLVLGLGTGYAQDEHDSIGLELRPPPARVDRFKECVAIVRDLLDTDASHRDGEHHTVAVDRLGVRPAAERVPILIGGFGRRVMRIAARFADIFQFTGLSDASNDGNLGAGGFGLPEVTRRAAWLTEAAGDRDAAIERSSLVQAVHVGDGAPSAAELAARFEVDESVVPDSPFVLVGTIDQLVDKLERVRAATGISHYTIREPEQFAPVVAALRGR